MKYYVFFGVEFLFIAIISALVGWVSEEYSLLVICFAAFVCILLVLAFAVEPKKKE